MRLLLCSALFCLVATWAAASTSSKAKWNVTQPYLTASPINGEEAPTPHAIISKALGLYAYVDTNYQVNVVNLTDGTHPWAHSVQGSLGLQFAEAYGQLIFNSLSLNTLQGRNAKTGAILWSQPSNFTANLPALLYKGRYLTAQLQTSQDSFFMYQVDVATGQPAWQFQGAADINGECGDGITVADSASVQELYTFGVNLTNGNITWVNPQVWGHFVGCLHTKAHTPLAVFTNGLSDSPTVSVVHPVTGLTIRNITVMQHFHAYEVFAYTGSVFCANVMQGEFTGYYQFFVECYDAETGNNTMSMNITGEYVQGAYVLEGHVVLLKRNYATGGTVVATAYDPETGALAWNITSIPSRFTRLVFNDVAGENMLIGSYLVITTDDGFSALSHRRGSFHVTGLGTSVRIDSIRTTDDFASTVVLTTRHHGIRLALTD